MLNCWKIIGVKSCEWETFSCRFILQFACLHHVRVTFCRGMYIFACSCHFELSQFLFLLFLYKWWQPNVIWMHKYAHISTGIIVTKYQQLSSVPADPNTEQFFSIPIKGVLFWGFYYCNHIQYFHYCDFKFYVQL